MDYAQSKTVYRQSLMEFIEHGLRYVFPARPGTYEDQRICIGNKELLTELTLLGVAHIGPAVIGHEGSTVVVVFNALRLLAYKQ